MSSNATEINDRTELQPDRLKDGHCSICGQAQGDGSSLEQPSKSNYYSAKDELCELCLEHGTRQATVYETMDREDLQHYDTDTHEAVVTLTRGAIRESNSVTQIVDNRSDMAETRITVRASRTPHPYSNTGISSEAVITVDAYGAGVSDVYAGPATAVYDALSELVDEGWIIKESGFTLRLDD